MGGAFLRFFALHSCIIPRLKKVLQITFSGSWDWDGCLPHITRAWARNARNYEHYFASWAGENYRGELEGRPHYGFIENARANRIYNKILRLNKFCFFGLVPIIEELRPDILHIHNRHDLVDQLMARLSYRPKIVCIYHQCYNKLFVPAARRAAQSLSLGSDSSPKGNGEDAFPQLREQPQGHAESLCRGRNIAGRRV
jgi:hypothetical protein